MRWFEVSEKDIAKWINLKIVKIFFLKPGLPLHKYINPFLRIKDGCAEHP